MRATDSVIAPPANRFRGRLRADLSAAATTAVFGAAAVALVDFVATIVEASESVRIATALRLLALEMSLVGLALLLIVPLVVALTAGIRLFLRLAARASEPAWPGLFPAAQLGSGRPGPAAAWAWALLLGALLFAGASTLVTLVLTNRFREPTLRALLGAVLQLILLAILIGPINLARVGIAALGRRLHARLGRFNLFGRLPAAVAAWMLLVLPTAKVTTVLLPQLAPLIPWRHILAACAFIGGCYGASVLRARRGHLFPVQRRSRWIAAAAAAVFILGLIPATLLRFGADPDAKGLAVSSSPPVSTLIGLVRRATDFDGDSFGFLLGENDCDPFDASISPFARDIPDNGIDENCDGRDFSLGALPTYRSGERMPVPEAFQEDWNFLLITVDTVRYDHTNMDGYHERVGRNTTPNLADFARRAVSFTFANAPSAGTMASIPAILTSKFFHSGIALDEKVKRGMPPKLKPQNTLISEVLKERGYRTGAILTHYYFNDWGMEQGFDDYDNELGAKNDPYNVTSDGVTERAISWIGRNSGKKWFLWAHYIDPHGRYVAHPGEVSFGSSEEDLYDGELAFTDKHLGRLLDYVAHSDVAGRTVILITSDHGDAFNEHGFINHGQHLYRELLHVPLIVYVPNAEPREVPGAVSPIDLYPTIADLAGADISELDILGESLVPQLFYGKDAHNRVVFAETNYMRTLRAAVTSRHKLIRDLKNNVNMLFDLESDPWEKKNLASRGGPALEKMKRYLDDWLERVYYARDPETNQAMAQLADFLVRDVPKEARTIDAVSFDQGHIQVAAIETDKGLYRVNDHIKIALYLKVADRPSGDFKLQVEAWVAGAPASSIKARSKLRFTGNGVLPSSRWRPGEIIRDRFKIKIPASWAKDEPQIVKIGLRMTPSDGSHLAPTGATAAGDDDLAIVGEATLEAGRAPAPAKSPPARRPGLAPR